MICDDLQGLDGVDSREAYEGGVICIHVSESHCCVAAANTTL